METSPLPFNKALQAIKSMSVDLEELTNFVDLITPDFTPIEKKNLRGILIGQIKKKLEEINDGPWNKPFSTDKHEKWVLTTKLKDIFFIPTFYTQEQAWGLIAEYRDEAKYTLPLDNFNYAINTLMQEIHEGQQDKALHFHPYLLMYVEVEAMNKVIVEKFKQIKQPIPMIPKENTTRERGKPYDDKFIKPLVGVILDAPDENEKRRRDDQNTKLK
jgi:hypothetical protein